MSKPQSLNTVDEKLTTQEKTKVILGNNDIAYSWKIQLEELQNWIKSQQKELK